MALCRHAAVPQNDAERGRPGLPRTAGYRRPRAGEVMPGCRATTRIALSRCGEEHYLDRRAAMSSLGLIALLLPAAAHPSGFGTLTLDLFVGPRGLGESTLRSSRARGRGTSPFPPPPRAKRSATCWPHRRERDTAQHMTASQVASVVAPADVRCRPESSQRQAHLDRLAVDEGRDVRRHAHRSSQVALSDGIEVIASGQSRQIVEHIGHLIRNRVV